MLVIDHLQAQVEGKEILKGVNLTIKKGEIHAIMGPNGAGKSTLAKVLAGDPSFEVTDGNLSLDGENLLEMEPDERANRGLFMSFQYPPEIPGINNVDFLMAAYNAKRKHLQLAPMEQAEFLALLDKKMKEVQVKEEFKERNLNEGFSGGEKKRNEILQMALLDPKVAVLDETDSGLDIDALKVVASSVKGLLSENNSLLLITHYERLLEYIEPDFIHVMIDGKIVKSGGKELARELEEKGYDFLLNEVRG